MKQNIALIGDGNVGSAIQKGLEKAGYETKSVGHNPGQVKELADWGQIIFLAVPYTAINDTIKELGDGVRGKTVVDVTNPLDKNMQMSIGFTTSAAEEIQKKLPNAHVVKAFNYVFAQNMSTGKVKDNPITLFVAGDDKSAKENVLNLGKDIGFDPIDVGPLQNARWLETLGYMVIKLGYSQNMGRDIGIKLVH